MILRPYKFIVQAIPQEIDSEGNVIGELDGQDGRPGLNIQTVYGCDQLAEWAKAFPDKLAKAKTDATQQS